MHNAMTRMAENSSAVPITHDMSVIYANILKYTEIYGLTIYQRIFGSRGEVGPFDIQGLRRKEETIIHRLRIGHTRLTHSYLMEQRGRFKVPPICKFCNDPDTVMSVHHILIECPELYYQRLDFYLVPGLQYLFQNVPLSTIIDFRQIDIYIDNRHLQRNLSFSI